MCFFILWWQTGCFPGTTVTVKWQWVMQMFFFNLFSLFLKGEELFLPIYSLCVCVNTFILNLKLIKYHFSQMSSAVLFNFCVQWTTISQIYIFLVKKNCKVNKSGKKLHFIIFLRPLRFTETMDNIIQSVDILLTVSDTVWQNLLSHRIQHIFFHCDSFSRIFSCHFM